jgi:hypothetical protein
MIQMNTNGRTTLIDWLIGWERVFTYTGEAIAVKYIDMEPAVQDPIDLFHR